MLGGRRNPLKRSLRSPVVPYLSGSPPARAGSSMGQLRPQASPFGGEKSGKNAGQNSRALDHKCLRKLGFGADTLPPIRFDLPNSGRKQPQRSCDQDPGQGHNSGSEEEFGQAVAATIAGFREFATRQQPSEFLGEVEQGCSDIRCGGDHRGGRRRRGTVSGLIVDDTVTSVLPFHRSHPGVAPWTDVWWASVPLVYSPAVVRDSQRTRKRRRRRC